VGAACTITRKPPILVDFTKRDNEQASTTKS
jgi:hypothetical protein